MRTGRIKGRSIIQFGMLVTQIPKYQAKLHIFSPFPHPPSHSWSPGSHNRKETSWAQRKWKADSIRAGSLILKWLWVQEALFSPQQWGWTHNCPLWFLSNILPNYSSSGRSTQDLRATKKNSLSLSFLPCTSQMLQLEMRLTDTSPALSHSVNCY